MLPLLLTGEEGEDRFALPERGRPRFRRYDQRPVPVRSTGTLSNGEEAESREEPDLSSEALRGFRLDTASQYGFSRINEIPLIGPSGPRMTEEEPPEEDGDSFLNPMDFLTEEDLIDNTLEEDSDEGVGETETEVMEWDSLQASMIEEALEEENEPETGEGDAFSPEGDAGEPPERSEVSETGLGLSNVLEGEDGGGMTGLADAAPVGAGEAGGRREPAVESALRMDLLRAAPAREVGEELEPGESTRDTLSGSRRLFSEIRERWEPGGGTSPRTEPTTAPRTLEPMRPAMPRPEPVTTSLTPASRFPDPVSPPPARQVNPNAQGGRGSEPAPVSRGRFREDDGRVQSFIRRQP